MSVWQQATRRAAAAKDVWRATSHVRQQLSTEHAQERSIISAAEEERKRGMLQRLDRLSRRMAARTKHRRLVLVFTEWRTLHLLRAAESGRLRAVAIGHREMDAMERRVSDFARKLRRRRRMARIMTAWRIELANGEPEPEPEQTDASVQTEPGIPSGLEPEPEPEQTDSLVQTEPDDDDLIADNHHLQLQLTNIRTKYQQLQISTIQRLYRRKAWMQLYKAATALLSKALLSELQRKPAPARSTAARSTPRGPRRVPEESSSPPGHSPSPPRVPVTSMRRTADASPHSGWRRNSGRPASHRVGGGWGRR
jgi:hypothetical protein